jgi:hypothetical protein
MSEHCYHPWPDQASNKFWSIKDGIGLYQTLLECAASFVMNVISDCDSLHSVSCLCIFLLHWDHVAAQVVICRLLTAESRLRAPVRPCGICGGQSGTGTSSSPSPSAFPSQYHSTSAVLSRRMKEETVRSQCHWETLSPRRNKSNNNVNVVVLDHKVLSVEVMTVEVFGVVVNDFNMNLTSIRIEFYISTALYLVAYPKCVLDGSCTNSFTFFLGCSCPK